MLAVISIYAVMLVPVPADPENEDPRIMVFILSTLDPILSYPNVGSILIGYIASSKNSWGVIISKTSPLRFNSPQTQLLLAS